MSSPSRRALLLRACRFLVVLVALLSPWPGLGRAYVGTFSRVGTAVIAPLLGRPGVEVSLEASPEDDAHHEWFAMVMVRDALSHAQLHRGAADLRRAGYLQIAVLVAVAIAFPLRSALRCVAFVAAAAVFLGMFGWLPALAYLARKGVIHLGTVTFAALEIAQRSVVGAPGMVFAVPAMLWLIVLRVLNPERARHRSGHWSPKMTPASTPTLPVTTGAGAASPGLTQSRTTAVPESSPAATANGDDVPLHESP